VAVGSARLVAAVVLVAGAVVVAPAVARADIDGEGGPRSGFTFGVSPMGASFAATDCCAIEGAGAALSLRVGTGATPSMLWILQLDSGAVAVRDAEDAVHLNTNVALTLGAQVYARRALWWKVGAGFATYTIREGGDTTDAASLERNGYALLASVGYDVFRARRFVIDLEIISVVAVYPAGGATITGGDADADAGVIAQMGLGFGLQWY
jgi:hypothetical protein